MSENDLLKWVIDIARLNGWRAFHLRTSALRGVSPHGFIMGPGAEGFPDLVLARRARDGDRGRLLFRELKSEKGVVSAAQAEWGAILIAAGADWDVWRPRDRRSIELQLSGRG